MEILKILDNDSIDIEYRIEHTLSMITKKLKIKFLVRHIKECKFHDGGTVFGLLMDKKSVKAIEACELYLQGRVTDEELKAAADAAGDVANTYSRTRDAAVASAAYVAAFASTDTYAAAYIAADTAAYYTADSYVPDTANTAAYIAARKTQLNILKEMFTEIESNA